MHLLKTLLMLIIAIIVIGAIVIFVGWARFPDMVAGNISKKMKLNVDIGAIDLSTKGIDVERLEIENLRGSRIPKAFSAETIEIRAPLENYFHDYVEIETITIDGIYLGIEFNSISGTDGNWTTIMKNYKKSTEGQKTNKKVLIKKLILTNISADLVYDSESNSGVRRLPAIPRMEFTNVTSEGGIPSDQIMQSVLAQMLVAIFKEENLKNMLDNIFEAPFKDSFDIITEPFKKLF